VSVYLLLKFRRIMGEDIIKDLNHEFEGVFDYFKGEIAQIRAGRANPALVENLSVDYYGTPTPLKQIASLSAPQANLIVIEPWDKNALPAITKAIESSELSLAPIVEGHIIRINLPPLSQERREQMIRLLHEKTEEARIALRLRREEAIKKAQELKDNKEIGEDEWFRLKDKIQKEINEANNEVKKLSESKQKEITS
jgi:ribosome recycling factor